ncbi:hypothetical protein P8452_73555 [Trifolium repens]|nr:hypothetical protein P8452_73555 [Trifolium repens]
MENQHTKGKEFEKSPWMNEQFTWKISNFSKFDSKTYSESFILSGFPWRIIMYPKGNKNSLGYLSLSIYLDISEIDNFHKEWRRYVNLELAVTNQADASLTIVKETEQEFKSSNHYCWSVDKFIHLDELRNSWSGYTVNDTLIIKARITSVKERFYKRLKVEQEVSEAESSPAQPISVMENSTAPSCDNLVDFKGLGRVEKEFVPLLEEVCSQHPSLVDNQKKRNRTPRFTEWAFTALGRVLHFLNTKMVKDMNEDGCHQLQILWEELETVGFDLSWLEPYFQSAMSKKNYVQRYENVKKLRKNVANLEKNLAKARKQLVEAEKGFVEKDLDAKLGYGAP